MKTKRPFTITGAKYTLDITKNSTGQTVLDVKTRKTNIVKVRIDIEPLSWCQYFFAYELEHNLGLDKQSKEYERRMKAFRKSLGYSYP